MSTVRCPLTVVWDDRFRAYDFGPDHPFTEASRELAVRLLEASGFFAPEPAAGPRVRLDQVEVASDESLRRFHTPRYIDKVRRAGEADPPGLLDRGDTPAFPDCHEAAARIAGGTLRALEIVQGEPGHHAFNPAGGLHHAHPDRASGFCIYNDAALAIRSALGGSSGLRRVAYVDIDAHHGDGVMYGLYDDGRVLDIDFHQDGRTLFPGTGFPEETGRGDGAGLKVNVPLPPGAGDPSFVALFDRIVPPLLAEFRPELIVLQAGVDGHAGDPLARLALTARSYDHAVAALHRIAHDAGSGRILAMGGGGYSAASVTRVLARIAGQLAGRPYGHNPEDPTPSSWRAAYEASLGKPAPPDWREVAEPERPLAIPGWRDTLVESLARSLGRSL